MPTARDKVASDDAPAGSDPRLLAMRKLRAEGMSYAKIAAEMKCSSTTVARVLSVPKKKKTARSTDKRHAPSPVVSKAALDPVQEMETPSPPTDDSRSLTLRLEEAVRAQILQAEKFLATSSQTQAERHARTLASLVKSLAELRKLEREEASRATSKETDQADDDTPSAIDMARLQRKLEDEFARLHAERESASAEGALPV